MSLSLDSFRKIDAHIHYNCRKYDALNYASEKKFDLVSINSEIDYFPPLRQQEKVILDFKKKDKNNIAFITSFSTKNWGRKGWKDEAIGQIEEGLNKGAIGVKIWKNIGMTLQDGDGRFILIDDTSFDPIYDYMESNKITLLNHLAEPRNCWMPLDKMTVENDRAYFREHPEYHMYLHDEIPSYQEQLDARDRMLLKHPALRYVGAHLATLEWSVEKLAEWLDRFPNCAVDTAARMCHLQHRAVHDREKVRDFMMSYSDRIIYGSDLSRKKTKLDLSGDIRKGYLMARYTAKKLLTFSRPDYSIFSNTSPRQKWGKRWDNDWRFLATNDHMSVPEVKNQFQGLGLPVTVLRKIYYENAFQWYPKLKR